MNCKNCKSEITKSDNFCNNCGAKVIKERVTIKSLFSNLLKTLGWDSNFFITLRFLIYKPQIIIKEYLNGIRKKYTNPFTFFAISLAISLFVFNQYSEQFILMSTPTNIQLINEVKNVSTSNPNKNNKIFEIVYDPEAQKAFMEFQLKHYNLISFLFLPIFALIAFLVFGKPYNYAEHLLINTYLLGIITFFRVLIFMFSLIIKFNILSFENFFTFIFYFYTYKKIYKLTFGKLSFKILKFIGMLLVIVTIGSGIISILKSFVLALIKSKL